MGRIQDCSSNKFISPFCFTVLDNCIVENILLYVSFYSICGTGTVQKRARLDPPKCEFSCKTSKGKVCHSLLLSRSKLNLLSGYQYHRCVLHHFTTNVHCTLYMIIHELIVTSWSSYYHDPIIQLFTIVQLLPLSSYYHNRIIIP